MRIEQLEFFVAIVEAGSINKASKHLLTAQQNVSKSLKQLEEELGYLLLERTKYGMCLTEEGSDFLQFAQTTLNELKHLKSHWVQKHQFSRLQGTIGLVASMSSTGSVLAEILPEFNKLYPFISLNIQEVDSQQVFDLIQSGQSGLGLTIDIQSADFSTMPSALAQDLASKSLRQEKLLILAGQNSPLAQQKNISIQNALTYPFALTCKHDYHNSAFFQLLAHHGRPNVVLTTGNRRLCLKGIESNSYITIVPESTMNTAQKNVHYLGLTDNYTCFTKLIYKKDGDLSALEQCLLDFIIHTWCVNPNDL